VKVKKVQGGKQQEPARRRAGRDLEGEQEPPLFSAVIAELGIYAPTILILTQ
jgi:hypothetical protein